MPFTSRNGRSHATQQARVGAAVRRLGFTFVEILTVFTIFGIMSVFAVPKLRGYKEKADLRSAKQHLTAYLTTARAAGIRRGRATNFVVATGDNISVTTDSSGTMVPLARPFGMKDVYKTTLPKGPMTITFDRRGFATSLGATAIIVVQNTSGKDSVCVTRLGVIMVDACTP